MASMDVSDVSVAEIPPPIRFGVLALPQRLWRRMVKRIDERRVLHKLYQLDVHALRDMGFDPDAIYAAREGAIGDLRRRARDDL